MDAAPRLSREIAPDETLVGAFRLAARALGRVHPTTLDGIERLPPGAALLVGNHGLLGYETLLFFERLFSETGRVPRGLADRWFFRVPLLRDLLRRVGGVRGSPEHAMRALSAGHLVVCYPGGAREVLKHDASMHYRLQWEKSLGFARLALRARVPIVPFAAAGVDDTFQVVRRIAGSGELLMGHAKYDLPMLRAPFPRAVPFYFRLGEPIAVEGDPDDEARVADVHREVWTRTQRLLDELVAEHPMRVLILGGGGTLGAFSAGALRALDRAGWHADALIGSSAGSINLLRAFVGGADAACDFWTSLTARELLSAAALHNVLRDGLLSPRQLYARVDAGVDFARVLADPRPISFIVVDLQTGKVAVRGNRTEASAADLRDVAHGSFSLPPLLPAVRLGPHLLADGGFLRNAPLETALALGATEIVYLCNVQVTPRDDFAPSWAPRTLLRYANIYFRRASNIGYVDAPIVESHYHGVPFLTIAPPSSLRLFQAALPTGAAMKKLVAMGEQRARRAIEAAQHVAPDIGESGGMRPSIVG